MSSVLADLHSLARLAWRTLALRGVFALAIGIFILARPLDSIAALSLLVAWWALLSGAVDVVHAIGLAPARHWWVEFVSGLVGIGFGVAALVYYPVLSLTFVVVWTAAWLMGIGILGTLGSVVQKQVGLPWGWTMAFGVLSILAAVFALVAPPATLGALLGLTGAFAITAGVMLIAGAFRIRSLTQA